MDAQQKSPADALRRKRLRNKITWGIVVLITAAGLFARFQSFINR